MASISQVILHAELMQIRPQLVCKIACFCGQKHPQSQTKTAAIADKSICNRRQKYPQLQAKYLQSQAKIPAIARNITHHRKQNYPLLQAKYPLFQAKIPAIPGKNTRNCN